MYVGGLFTIIGGRARSDIAALDATTGLATEWNRGRAARVYALATSGPTVYAGGDFTSIGGQSRNFIAALDAATGLATAWNPDADYGVFTLAVGGSRTYAGGDFNNIGGQPNEGFVAFQDLPTPTLLARFEVEATSAGVQLRWQFGEPGRVVGVALERAANRVRSVDGADVGESPHG